MTAIGRNPPSSIDLGSPSREMASQPRLRRLRRPCRWLSVALSLGVLVATLVKTSINSDAIIAFSNVNVSEVFGVVPFLRGNHSRCYNYTMSGIKTDVIEVCLPSAALRGGSLEFFTSSRKLASFVGTEVLKFISWFRSCSINTRAGCPLTLPSVHKPEEYSFYHSCPVYTSLYSDHVLLCINRKMQLTHLKMQGHVYSHDDLAAFLSLVFHHFER
jgi:hypothetical protein